MLKNVSIYLGLSSLLWVSASAAAQENSTPSAAPALNIEGRTWRMSGFEYVSPLQLPSRGSRHKPAVYIKFQDGAIEGSSGCGQLTGSYRQEGEQLMISAEWRDREGSPCNDDEKEQGRRVLNALSHVQRIQAEAPKWHQDTLDLVDNEGKLQILLWPTQSGADLSELDDTFWHLKLLSGSEADFSSVVIHIGGRGSGGIIFSTLSQEFLVPFVYRWAGMEFHPASQQATKQYIKSPQELQLRTVFENALLEVQSYELNAGRVTFLNKDREPIIVLSDFPKEGIENRTWRIAKCRGDGTQPSDENGLIESGMAFILFMSGRVTGSPGCGGWSGTYKVSGGRLKVDAEPSFFGTPCDYQFTAEHLVKFRENDLVVNAFKGELWITKQDDRIILRDSNGRPRIVLVPY
jgi:heat shock protein HslJ